MRHETSSSLADLITLVSNPHQEVVRLDIPMDEVLRMNVLHPTDHLIRQHENGLDGEATGAEFEEIPQGRSQHVHHQYVVISFLSEPSVMSNH
jgi:hypothetical protein